MRFKLYYITCSLLLVSVIASLQGSDRSGRLELYANALLDPSVVVLVVETHSKGDGLSTMKDGTLLQKRPGYFEMRRETGTRLLLVVGRLCGDADNAILISRTPALVRDPKVVEPFLATRGSRWVVFLESPYERINNPRWVTRVMEIGWDNFINDEMFFDFYNSLSGMAINLFWPDDANFVMPEWTPTWNNREFDDFQKITSFICVARSMEFNLSVVEALGNIKEDMDTRFGIEFIDMLQMKIISDYIN